MEWQCLVSVLRSLGTWTSRQRGNRVMYPDLSAPELQSSSSGAVPDDLESEVKDESKGPTQADEFEKAKALKVTMGSAVAKVYLFFAETILIIAEDFVCARRCTSKYLL